MRNGIEIISPAKSVQANCQPLFRRNWVLSHCFSLKNGSYFLQNVEKSHSVYSEGLLESRIGVRAPNKIPLRCNRRQDRMVILFLDAFNIKSRAVIHTFKRCLCLADIMADARDVRRRVLRCLFLCTSRFNA